MSERPPSVIDDRTYQRRRLGVLVGLLVLVLAASPFLGGGGGGDDVVEVAAAGSPSPVDLGALRPAAVTRALAAPQAIVTTTTETTAALAAQASTPTTTEPPAPATTAPAPTTTEPVAPAAPAPSTTAAPATTTEGATAEAMVSPTTAPPATAPPTTAPPTTAAPAPAPEPAEPTDPSGTAVWYELARCESGGRWSLDTGNGYYGGLQFSLGSWQAVGGTGHPHEHPAQTQIEMGRRLQAAQGWGAWPHCASQLGLR